MADKRASMTGPEFDAALRSIGWLESAAAEKLGVSRSYIGQLRRSERPVSQSDEDYVLDVQRAVVSVQRPRP